MHYPLWHPYTPMNGLENQLTILVSGGGCRVRDRRGKEYIDASGGLWSAQCGLGHTTIIAAITEQLQRLSCATLFASRGNEAALNLAQALVELVPGSLHWVYLTNSGSESVELAIKLARLYFEVSGQKKRKEIVYLDRSYHGTFFGSMTVSGLSAEKDSFGPLLPGTMSIRAPCADRCPSGMSYDNFALVCALELEEVIRRRGDRIAAFIVEPVLGSAGVVVPPANYFDTVQGICRREGVLLILDEVATGFGRTGRWFACEHFGIAPDIMLLSKGISSGYLPLGAVLFRREIGEALIREGVGIGHGSSHNGNPACCAAGIETIRVIQREGLVQRAADIGAYFRNRLEELRRYPAVREVRSLGLMLGVELVQEDLTSVTPAQMGTIYVALERAGVLAYPAETTLIFMPALVILEEEVDIIIEALHGILSRVRLRNDVVEPAVSFSSE